jgi:hypothetical protein
MRFLTKKLSEIIGEVIRELMFQEQQDSWMISKISDSVKHSVVVYHLTSGDLLIPESKPALIDAAQAEVEEVLATTTWV